METEENEKYSIIKNDGFLEFVDLQNCDSECSYNPSNESQIVNISVPFPLVERKPQSGFVGETMFDSICIKNITDKPLDIWSVRIYDSKPENSFTISLMEPPSVNSDEQYVQDFIEAFSFEDRVLRTDRDFTIWLSCKPKETGLHSTAVHFSIDNEVIERLAFVLAEDKESQSLSSSKPFYRARKKKPNVLDQAFVAGRRPSEGSIHGSMHWLPKYTIPAHIRDTVINQQIPDVVNEGLTRKNYVSFFKTLLAMEEIKMEEDMRAYDMESVTMNSNGKQFLSLVVPGLAEKRPSLVNGDHIFVKLASEDETAKVYEGYIHRVEAKEIFLYFDSKFHKNHRESNLYNVQFTYNRTCMLRLYQAVEAAKCLDGSFLFPTVSNMRLVKLKPGPFVPISCNPNEEQTRAIKMILACKGGCPYVIHGPPGTGKTMTLIESILQIYHSWKKARILVCSTSNNAADHLLDRLISEESAVIEPRDIFRLNASTRPFEDVNPNYIDFCCVEDFIFTCPSRGDLEKFRIVISTYRSASLLHEQGIKRGHFSHIFLDEAGHASEPETMVPLSHLYSNNTVVVLAGDPLQLGPVVFCKDAEINGLGTSYLERLCELYANGDENVMTKLIRNYRTHPAILYLPSHLFYDGVLIPCKEENSGFMTSMDDLIRDKEFPLLFVGILGWDEQEIRNPSWINRIEASKVVEITRVLIEKKGVKEENVGVITPYSQQVLNIRGALESLGRPNIKVGSVEEFQGQEYQVIIISTVRSTIKYNDFDRVHSLGFLNNPRRFNVALTRAKSLLIVIGNPHILCKDPHWNELLWYCVDKGCYQGCFLPEKAD